MEQQKQLQAAGLLRGEQLRRCLTARSMDPTGSEVSIFPSRSGRAQCPNAVCRGRSPSRSSRASSLSPRRSLNATVPVNAAIASRMSMPSEMRSRDTNPDIEIIATVRVPESAVGNGIDPVMIMPKTTTVARTRNTMSRQDQRPS